jgi:ABC-type lipoprotein release transport system permease subunit
MTSRALAWRTVTANPARAVLAVSGVAVIGALLFDMLLLSDGLLISFRALLDTGGYDVRVVAGEGLPTARMPINGAKALIAGIARLPEVAQVVSVRVEPATAAFPRSARDAITLLTVSAGAERQSWRIVEGRDLEPGGLDLNRPPLVIGRGVAKARGLGVGSTLEISASVSGSASAIPPVTFHIVGLAEFMFDGSNDVTAATSAAGLDRVRGGAAPDDAEVILVASRPEAGAEAAVSAIKRLRPELRVFSNEQLVTQFAQNDFSYFRQISAVLSAITLSFSFLLIATLLVVSVNQRLSEMAALRALGFPRRRIAATLLWESAWLVGAGGGLALPIGALVALQFDRILRSMPGIPDQIHFFVFEPRAFVLHTALLAATGAAAAAYPIWIAARLPIAETLRREAV